MCLHEAVNASEEPSPRRHSHSSTTGATHTTPSFHRFLAIACGLEEEGDDATSLTNTLEIVVSHLRMSQEKRGFEKRKFSSEAESPEK